MEQRTRARLAAVGAALGLITGGVATASSAPAASARGNGPAVVRSSQVLAVATTSATAGAVTGRWAGSVDTGNRDAVNAAYLNGYVSGASLPTGYTGDVSRCRVGTTSDQSRAATLRAINFVRSLGGLAPVSLASDLNTRSQYTALIMSANKKLSHYPTSDWKCYTSTGAANAARSNLALAYPSLTSAGVVGLYMNEAGGSNTAVGHRRWLLNPFSTAMGSGSTNDANAITVIGPTNLYRPNPRYVGWPTAGWFPSSLEPSGRWSLSAGNRRTNFSKATVAVWRNGVRLYPTKQPVKTGYAQPTMVWEMPDSLARSGKFHVVVRNIHLGTSTTRYSYAYDVSMFTPTQ